MFTMKEEEELSYLFGWYYETGCLDYAHRVGGNWNCEEGDERRPKKGQHEAYIWTKATITFTDIDYIYRRKLSKFEIKPKEEEKENMSADSKIVERLKVSISERQASLKKEKQEMIRLEDQIEHTTSSIYLLEEEIEDLTKILKGE